MFDLTPSTFLQVLVSADIRAQSWATFLQRLLAPRSACYALMVFSNKNGFYFSFVYFFASPNPLLSIRL